MKHVLFIFSVIYSTIAFSQEPCSYVLKSASAVLTNGKEQHVEMMEVKIKNDYLIHFIKVDKKNYLKIIVRDNLGFGKKGALSLSSIKKQIYVKSTTLNIIDKESGYFLVEMNNTYYLDNLKEFGISKITFDEKAEFSVPKYDSDQIKIAAQCFFDIIKDNIWPPVKKL